MGLRRAASDPVAKMLFERYVVPQANFKGIEMIDGAEGVKLVQAGCHASILKVRQAADVDDEFRPAAPVREFVAGPFDIAVGEAKSLASLPKKRAWYHRPPTRG